jgi:hypothetical protein
MTSYTFDPIHILNSSDTTSITGGGSFAVDGGASVGKNLYVGGTKYRCYSTRNRNNHS